VVEKLCDDFFSFPICLPVLNVCETCLMVRRDYGLIVFENEC
jgi:hypothetical protein